MPNKKKGTNGNMSSIAMNEFESVLRSWKLFEQNRIFNRLKEFDVGISNTDLLFAIPYLIYCNSTRNKFVFKISL